VKGYKYF